MMMMIGLHHPEPLLSESFYQLCWKRIQHPILHHLQALLQSDDTLIASLNSKALDQKLLHQHSQQGTTFHALL
jgi:hypothetical protein